MDRNVLVGYIHPGTVRAEFMASVVQTIRRTALNLVDVVGVRSGPNVGNARNALASMFLRTDAAWLWTVDTDMMFAGDTLDRLHAAADPETRPVVGAYYLQESEAEPYPTMYRLEPRGDRLVFDRRHEWLDNECEQVDATGAGCLLIHRSALQRIGDQADEWFQPERIGGLWLGEDIAFCARAAAAGVPIHVHTGIQVGHIKSTILGKVR